MRSKQEIRRMLKAGRPTAPAGEASCIIRLLESHPRIQEAHTLLLYSALPDEVPLQELIDKLASKGKTVLLPRVNNDTEMELRHYTGIHDLRKGAFGIMEPVGESYTDYSHIDVAVIPGIAFDQEGHRLGRGRGYYDRFLPLLPNTYKIGVCYPFRLLDHLPTDEHDVSMDCVIS